MKFHLWWFIMYLSSMCYFNSNHCNGFILGSHLSDVLGSLSDYYFFFFFVFYLLISACTCVCAHVYMCVCGGGRLGSMCIWRPEEGAIGIPGMWKTTWLVVWVLVSKLQSSCLHSKSLKTWIISPASSFYVYGINITIPFFPDFPYLSKTF